MRAVDSSVVIAAFATWHEHHAIARTAMAGRPRLVAHAAVESYSVLTRLPPPHRAHPSIVHAFVCERFVDPFLTLSEPGYQQLLAAMAARQILGGAVYDALIAFTAAVMGGIGNIRGAVLGGLIIGIVQQTSDYRLGTQWTEAVIFVYLILVMVLRPRGLLGEETREAG